MIKKFISFEHGLALCVVVISTLVGLLYGALFDVNTTITKMDFSNFSHIGIFWQILSHNFLVSIVVIILSIFLYIGSAIPVIITYFLFGDSFAVVVRENGIINALGTYPHFIFEAIETWLILAIAFKLSRKILNSVFSKNKKKLTLYELLSNFVVANIFLIVAAIIETIRIAI